MKKGSDMEITEYTITLIEELEYIVANCYHNKQKRGGFYYRYPRRFDMNGKVYESKAKGFISEKMLNTLRYETGANHLYIGKALVKILEFLEERYDLDFDELELDYEVTHYEDEDIFE